MNTKIYSLILGAALAMGLAACDDWNPQLSKQGTLKLTSMELDVNTDETLLSRADAQSVDISSFIVSILQGETVVNQWAYAAMPEIISLPVGEYTVQVKSHNVEKQAWNAPYYLGTRDFKIENNAITEIGTVTCAFSNLKVTIVYSDDLLEHLASDTKVTVVANDDGRLEYGLNETRSGFFEVLKESNTLVATFEGTVDGQMTTFSRSYTDVAPGTHYRITFSVGANNPDIPEETGSVTTGGGTGITVDTEAVDVNDNTEIEIEEDVIDNPGQRPGQEDEPDDPSTPDDPNQGEQSDYITFEPVAGAAIALKLDGTENRPGDFGDSNPAAITIKAEKKFANLVVTIASVNPTLYPLQVNLADVGLANTFDLANPGDLAGAISGLGLPVGDQVKGQTSVNFDITGFMELLPLLCEKPKFDIVVTDAEGNTASAVLIFNVNL